MRVTKLWKERGKWAPSFCSVAMSLDTVLPSWVVCDEWCLWESEWRHLKEIDVMGECFHFEIELLLILLFCNSSTGGLNFGTLGSSTATATTSAPSLGFGSGLFGSKSTTGFTLGSTSTGRKEFLYWKFWIQQWRYKWYLLKLGHTKMFTLLRSFCSLEYYLQFYIRIITVL